MTSHLGSFVSFCEEVSSVSCGLTSDDLNTCTQKWKGCIDSFTLPIVTLDLSFNHFLSHCDLDWMGASSEGDAGAAWSTWCELLLCHSPVLKNLDVCHCVTSPSQAALLCQGLQSGLLKRHQAGLPCLTSLIIQGLQQQCPSAASNLRTALSTEGLSGLSLDFGGVTHSL